MAKRSPEASLRIMVGRNPELAEEIIKDMPVAEAVLRARAWWEKTGRILMRAPERQEFITDERRRVSEKGPKSPLIVVKDRVLDLHESGLMLGRHWDYLTRPEQVKVVKAWLGQYRLAVNLPKLPDPPPAGASYVRRRN